MAIHPPKEYLRIAKDTIDRRPQFVAHIGEKSGFGPIRRFCVLFSIPKLDFILSQFSSTQVDGLHQLTLPQSHLPRPPAVKGIDSEDDQKSHGDLHPESPIPRRVDGE